MPKATLDKLRAQFPQALPYLMYGLTEAFRSTYLDPAEIDRRPDSIGKAIPNAEILVVRPMDRAAIPANTASLFTAARWWRWAIGTIRHGQPSAFGRRQVGTQVGGPPRSLSFLAIRLLRTRKAFCSSLAARTR